VSFPYRTASNALTFILLSKSKKWLARPEDKNAPAASRVARAQRRKKGRATLGQNRLSGTRVEGARYEAGRAFDQKCEPFFSSDWNQIVHEEIRIFRADLNHELHSIADLGRRGIAGAEQECSARDRSRSHGRQVEQPRGIGWTFGVA